MNMNIPISFTSNSSSNWKRFKWPWNASLAFLGKWNIAQNTCLNVRGKTRYEWHTDDIGVHTSDMRMTYEYIRLKNEWHTNTYR